LLFPPVSVFSARRGDCRFIQDKAWPGGAGGRGAGNAGGIFSHSWLQPEKPLIGAVWRVVVVPAVKAGSLMFFADNTGDSILCALSS
jgi:hypothetical protein